MRIGLVGLLLLAGSFSLFEWELAQGESTAAASTVAVNVFVVGELFYLFNCRSLTYSMFRLGIFSNPWALGGVVVMILLQIGFTYLPFMHVAFASAPIGADEWILVVATGMTIYLAVGLEKWLRRRAAART